VVNRLFAETSVNFVQSYVFFGGLLFLGLLYRLRAPAERSPPRSAWIPRRLTTVGTVYWPRLPGRVVKHEGPGV